MEITQRALLFRTLACAFAYPIEGRALEIREALCALAWTAGTDDIGRGVQGIRDAWRSVNDARLAADYRRLFGRGGPVALNETGYDAPSMAARAVVLADIDGLYRSFGFSPKSSELPDRLEAELDFVAVLLLKESYARTSDLKAQRRIAAQAIAAFLQQHLGRWVDRFADAIAAVDADTPYDGFARLLGVAVARECRQRRVRRAHTSGGMSHEVA